MSSAPEPPVIHTPAKRRLFLFLKIAGICVLIALLHIPLGMTHGVLRERQGYQRQATEEIQGTWGRSQLITGPVLVVPYSVTRKWTREIKDVENKVKTVEETSVNRGTAYILPTSLEVEADVAPEVRYRGIYEAVVYSAQVKLSGSIATNMDDIKVENAVYEWDRAWLQLGVSDARRLRAAPQLNLAGASYAVEPENADIVNLGLVAKVNAGGPSRELSFEMKLDLQGSERLEFSPVGKRTEVRMKSSWVNPSFTGAQLPVSRNVGDSGFDATWRMAHYGRGFPETWIDARIRSPVSAWHSRNPLMVTGWPSGRRNTACCSSSWCSPYSSCSR
ncbi:MAG: inner membrane CreD family protein [Opitutae bacterium]|nr:inner membrane CreD family protein [Opitutae bacterium]